MPESRFDAWVAERYDVLWPELFDPTLVEQTVDFLAALGRQQARRWSSESVPGASPCP